MIQQWISLCAAVFTVIVNVLAYRSTTQPVTVRNARPLFAINAAMATFYVGAFVVLLTGIDQGDWSRTLLWITPLAFLGPWSLSALTMLVYAAGKTRANGTDNGNDNTSPKA